MIMIFSITISIRIKILVRQCKSLLYLITIWYSISVYGESLSEKHIRSSVDKVFKKYLPAEGEYDFKQIRKEVSLCVNYDAKI